MRRLRSCRALWLVLLALFAAAISLGQGKKIADDREEQDHPREREQWFRRGRPSDGGKSAEKLHRAYRQKMAKRAARVQQSSTNTSAAVGAARTGATYSATTNAAAVPANGATWIPLGPAPEASDASGSGSQDYGPVTGRATAVAIDQSDKSGNTVYVGGAYGGLWKSTNAADPAVNPCSAASNASCATNVQWAPLIDNEATLAIGSIGIQPCDPTKTDCSNKVILVGTGESNSAADSYYGLGIMRSTQGAPGTWSLITSANNGLYPFRGLAFSRISFSTDNPNLVVASSAAASGGITVGGEVGTSPPSTSCTAGNTCRGLYYSTDAGQNWFYASSLSDGSGVSPQVGSAHSVVYHPLLHKFYAALRAHGIYSSSDGANWTRLPSQPGTITLQNCPSVTNLTSCPLYRAEIAVVPGRNEMYVWYVDANDNNGGVYQSLDGGNSWTALPISGMDNCGSGSSCGTEQGTYNLALAAIPNGTGTDVYAGAVNIFKCTIISPSNPSTCNFVNLTHVYGCTPIASYGHVHPDEHSFDFLHAGTASDYKLIYFANDGGIYRTLNSYAPASGTCGTTPYPFDNVNGGMGSMTQYVWFSHHPSDPATLLGGTQDNGSPATAQAGSTQAWISVNNGDGGFNDIDPGNPNLWYTSNNYVSVQRCANGINCTSGTFASAIASSQVGNDSGSFYTPFMLDPQNSGKMIVGTCRVWRGNSDGTTWSSSNALSYPNFSSLLTAACPKSDATNPPYDPDNISALAAGGPKSANNMSQVIWAGTEGYISSTGDRAGGRVWLTTNADVSLATWTDRTGNINPKHYPISSIALDPTDPTGMTAYVTVMGFDVSHVFRTLDGGATWVDFTGDLPDAPADAVVVDPGDPNTIYAGTDVGVFATTNGGVNWVEVGLNGSGGSTFPNVAITRMKIFSGGPTEHLRVSTYGRGVWDIDLGTTTAPTFAITLATSAVTVMAGQQTTLTGTLTPVKGYNQNVTVTCAGNTPATCTGGGTFSLTGGRQSFSFSIGNPTGGDFTFDIKGVGADGTTQVQSVTAHITDLQIGAPSVTSVTVPHGTTSDPVTFQVSAVSQFNGTVTLSCSGLPAGTTCAFSTPSFGLVPGGSMSETLTIAAQGTAPVGTYPISINASSSAAPTRSQQLELVVQLNPDFVLPSNPSSLGSVKATEMLTSSFSINTQDNYSGTVNLSCLVDTTGTCEVPPSVSLPNGNPVQIKVTPAVSSLSAGQVTVTATDGQKTHSVALPFTVMKFVPSNGAVVASLPGGTTTSTLTLTSQGNYTGSVNATCDSTALGSGATCTVASNPISVPAGGTANANVSISVPQTLTPGVYNLGITTTDAATPALTYTQTSALSVIDFSMAPSPSNRTVSAGGPASYTITVTPIGNGQASGTVDLACSGLPAYTTCSFTASTISVSNIPVTSTLTITTTAATARVRPISWWNGPAYALWLPLAGLSLVGAGVSARRRRLLLLALLVAVSALLLLQACGGGSGGNNGGSHPGTPAGTYNITVSGSVGSSQRSTTVTLTVQ